MRGLLWVLALFALAVGISLAMRVNHGYVLLVLPPYRAEISLNLAILLLLLGFAALYGFLRAASLTLSLPRRVREYRARRVREKAAEAFAEGVRLLFEGRFGKAMKKAVDAYRGEPSNALAALLAARAAQLLGEPDTLKEWLERALAQDPKMRQACLMLEAEAHLDARRFAEALDVLAQLQKLAGTHVAALRLELRAQQGCGNLDEVGRITRLLEKHGAQPVYPAEAGGG